MKLINIKMEIIKYIFSDTSQCFGCNKIGLSDKFIGFKLLIQECICMDCRNENKVNKLMRCINCGESFLLDFTQLKLNDTIQGGIYAFMCCNNCLENVDENKSRLYRGALLNLDSNRSIGDAECCDGWEYDIDENESNIRILGEFKINITQKIKENIQKKIYNCKQFDKKKFNRIGNIKYENIINILKIQDNKCHKCNDKVLLYNYQPKCLYQFSIDRLNNNEPHDNSNIKISCYFCNCKDHYLFDIKTKDCDIGCIH